MRTDGTLRTVSRVNALLQNISGPHRDTSDWPQEVARVKRVYGTPKVVKFYVSTPKKHFRLVVVIEYYYRQILIY